MIVAILPNLSKRGSSETLENIGRLFKSEGIDAYIPDDICCSNFNTAPEDELFKIADVIVTIGGDGTIMRYAKRAAIYGKPIIGINAGRVGYLANIEQSEYKILSNLKNGNYKVEERMLMRVTVCENGKVVSEHDVMNDAVISSGYISRIIDITASVDNDSVVYRADGLIASTPTGSTAYSMAAGGPIIDPVMESICLTPICSHMLYAKPMIISAKKKLILKAFSKKKSDIYISVDGRKVANIKPYTEVYLTQSPYKVKFICLNNRSFFKTLSIKFSDVRGVNSER